MKVIHILFIMSKVDKLTLDNYTKTCENRCLKVIIKKELTFLVLSKCCISLGAPGFSKFFSRFLSIIFPQFSTIMGRVFVDNFGYFGGFSDVLIISCRLFFYTSLNKYWSKTWCYLLAYSYLRSYESGRAHITRVGHTTYRHSTYGVEGDHRA